MSGDQPARIFFILLTCIAQFNIAVAQAPSLYFEKITVQNGLSHNKVNCILQDKRGFMWIGTDDGLNRYDGQHFTIFRNQPEDTSTVSGNIITGLLEDENGLLWIATLDGGLTRYDYRLPPSSQFKQYKHWPGDSRSIPGNSINAIMQDKQGYLWLATSRNSLLRFSKKTGLFETAVAQSRRTFLAICTDASGYVWAGGHGGGIFRINPKTLRHFNDTRYNNLYAKLPHPEISSFYRDTKDDIWFGSWDRHLYRYNSKDGSETAFTNKSKQLDFTNDEILCFAEDRNEMIWMGGHYNGLQLYNTRTGDFYSYKHDPSAEGSIADNRINCLFMDQNGLMWIGTGRGISISNPAQRQFAQTFLPMAGTGPSSIHTMYEKDNKELLIGTSNGLYTWNRATGQFTHDRVIHNGYELAVTAFFKDDNAFYVGTNFSLFSYNRNTHDLELLPNTNKDLVMNQLIESRIVSIIKDTIDGHPVLLVSPYGHFMAYYDLHDQRWVSRLDSNRKILNNFGLKDNLIHKFLKGPDGRIWMANATQGLGEWDLSGNKKIVYHTNDPMKAKSLSSNHVYDMVVTGKGDLWISTFGGGLHFYNAASKTITHIKGSPNLLEGLQTDDKGNVWMIASGELYRYDPARQLFFAINLPDLQKSGGVKGTLFKDDSGKLYVSGSNYFISFHPDSIEVERRINPILFTDFKIFEKSYSHLLASKAIVLPYYENSLSVSFAAPDFSFASPLRYAYMLEGVDKSWIEAGTDNTAHYPNLTGGDYTFKIKVVNHPSSDETIRILNITIIPPFWKRWWFYALCALAIAGIIYSIYRYRIMQLKKQQAIRNKIAQDLHDNMGSALSSISVYTQVAKIHSSRNEKESLDNVLQKMNQTSTEVITEMNDIVWAINPRNDSMEKILQRMESFARPLAAAKEIDLDFKIDEHVTLLNLDMEKRKNFYLIFKEAFTNAIKYADAKNMIVSIKLEHHRFVLVIQDDGNGFNTVDKLKGSSNGLAGNGLRNMQRRAKEMKGECQIISSVKKGTAIRLVFPV
jgi:ligand-binding sensor domain-containing protein/two-component sensor histidine kinase